MPRDTPLSTKERNAATQKVLALKKKHPDLTLQELAEMARNEVLSERSTT